MKLTRTVIMTRADFLQMLALKLAVSIPVEASIHIECDGEFVLHGRESTSDQDDEIIKVEWEEPEGATRAKTPNVR